MAKKIVMVGVIVNTGKIEVSVKPWSVDIATGDTVAWRATGAVTGITTHLSRKAAHWPFKATPSGKKFTRVTKRTFSTGKRRPGLRVGQVVRYTLDVEFTDPDGNTRKASIDPDMVIDV